MLLSTATFSVTFALLLLLAAFFAIALVICCCCRFFVCCCCCAAVASVHSVITILDPAGRFLVNSNIFLVDGSVGCFAGGLVSWP